MGPATLHEIVINFMLERKLWFRKPKFKVTEHLQTYLLLPLLIICFSSPTLSNVLYFPKENPKFLEWHIRQVPASFHVLEWPLSEPNISSQAVSLSQEYHCYTHKWALLPFYPHHCFSVLISGNALFPLSSEKHRSTSWSNKSTSSSVQLS